MLLVAVFGPLEIEVDRLLMLLLVVLSVENNWLPLIASVDVAVTSPAPTLMT
jgi:hypothetical protein